MYCISAVPGKLRPSRPGQASRNLSPSSPQQAGLDSVLVRGSKDFTFSVHSRKDCREQDDEVLQNGFA